VQRFGEKGDLEDRPSLDGFKIIDEGSDCEVVRRLNDHLPI
jgi:hypothetical protein